MLDHVEANSGPNAADNAKKAISALLSWAVRTSTRTPPTVSANAPQTLPGSAYSVSPSSCRFANALPSGDYGAIVKLLMLTAQRRDEIANLEWQEVDFEKAQIELPSSRTKNKRPHVIPLSAEAREIYRLGRTSRPAIRFWERASWLLRMVGLQNPAGCETAHAGMASPRPQAFCDNAHDGRRLRSATRRGGNRQSY